MFRWHATPGLEAFPPRSRTGRVLIGLVVGAAAAALRGALTFAVGSGVAFLLAYPSVLVAALLGGTVGGLTATAVGLIVATYMWLPPVGSMYIATLGDRLSAVVFTLSGVVMTLLVSHMHTLRAKVEREQTLMQLAQKVARFGTYVFDATTGEVSWSAGMYDLYGVPAGTPLNLRQWLNRIRAEDRDRVEASLRQAVAGRRAAWSEHFGIGFDTEPTHLATHARLTYGTLGDIHRIVGGVVDITAERRLAESNRRLAQMKDEFLARVSHEMRTPLNVALGRMHMLATGHVAPGQQQAVVDAAYRNLRSIWTLVNDLLEAARMASGRIELHRVPLDVAAALGHSIADARRHADAHGVKLEMRCDAKDTTVLGDGERLRQVFDNLVHNAVKFTPSGGSVDIRVTSYEDRVLVIVSDNGIGISAEELPLVFEPFQQGSPSRVREHGGLGLGLAIAKQLVEAHGGTIEAVSPGVGQGATFTVTLPSRSTIAA